MNSDSSARDMSQVQDPDPDAEEPVVSGDGHASGVRPHDGSSAESLSDAPELSVHHDPSDVEHDDAPAPNAPKEKAIEALDVNDRVVDVLLRHDRVTIDQVRTAQRRKREKNLTDALWRVLARSVQGERSVIYETAAQVYAFAAADLARHAPDPEFTRKTMNGLTDTQKERLLELGVVPHRVRDDRGTVDLITHDPMRPAVHRVARTLDLERFDLKYAPESKVGDLIAEAFPQENEYLERMRDNESVDLGQSYQEEDDDLVNEDRLEAAINRSTLINLFEATLIEAVREGASDIHIFPNADEEVEIHFRNDGRLDHWHTEHRVHPEALLSVIKDNSRNVDRFERDTAQDGFIQRWVDGTRIRFRVSVMPVAGASQEINAESIVIRVLDDRKVITDLDKLGLGEVALDRFEHAINQPHGMVILTGPTGSGKSTTLVAALHRVIGPEENVLTVEDPVEYIIEGARQIKLSDKLHLEDALRSILRHDPDTVMVGEMRDKDTAELAIKLANTGHLTFSTLHTNDAPSAISRLYKMGIEPFLIGYAINLVVAQRLIRTLCPECKCVAPNVDPVLLEQLGFTEKERRTVDFYTEGDDPNCSTCSGTGYKGRQAIAEALHFSRPIRHMIVDADDMVDESAIREHAEQEDGMLSLQASARSVVKRGETSIREMMRVVATDGT
jgi:type IV pilus assembly protein PilB